MKRTLSEAVFMTAIFFFFFYILIFIRKLSKHGSFYLSNHDYHYPMPNIIFICPQRLCYPKNNHRSEADQILKKKYSIYVNFCCCCLLRCIRVINNYNKHLHKLSIFSLKFDDPERHKSHQL